MCPEHERPERGSIDALVNDAALFSTLTMKPFNETSVDECDTVSSINTRGTFLCCREVGKVMMRQGSGRIVNIASGVVDDGRPNYLHYLSSRSAINVDGYSVVADGGCGALSRIASRRFHHRANAARQWRNPVPLITRQTPPESERSPA